MRVRDYLNTVSGNVTFIIVRAEKDEQSPFYHNIYQTTPIRQVWEWEESTSGLLDMLVVNKDCEPIDITGVWQNWYRKGGLKCCMIESEETLHTMYSETQAEDMINHYEKTVK